MDHIVYEDPDDRGRSAAYFLIRRAMSIASSSACS
jgi:hypothetical protein